MVRFFTKNLTRIIFLLPLPFVLGFLIPHTVMAEPGTPVCPDVRRQIEGTRQTLSLLEQHQQQLQQQVRAIYHELFACQTGSGLSLAQQHHCTQLQEEGPKQFQSMVEAITLHHRTSQQLAHQTRQAQLTCPTSAEGTFPKITQLPLQQKITKIH
jgi:hypothetical protein